MYKSGGINGESYANCVCVVITLTVWNYA
ncbi:hypothetical protein GBAR_LOCUS25042 [Geodia barretti]|uniref:Uncharacterized protein n=1 Tax=Geodia barretti TaxID=519541 RepID=A0AA35TC30_GEOBA|nr:hypothetical protein GBAR_LOCUS25042 [Geodia barretti]